MIFKTTYRSAFITALLILSPGILFAQNPEPELVIEYDRLIIGAGISGDGTVFTAITNKSNQQENEFFVHAASSKPKILFKKGVSFEEDKFTLKKIFVSEKGSYFVITGYLSDKSFGALTLPSTVVLDKNGDELWRANMEFIGFAKGEGRGLLARKFFDIDPEPCLKGENEEDYGCMRKVSMQTGEVEDLITFKGSLGKFGFVDMWGDSLIAIGTSEGDLFIKDTDDNLIWKQRMNGLIIRGLIDKTEGYLTVLTGAGDALFDINGKILWQGVLVQKKYKLSELPHYTYISLGISRGFNSNRIYLWKENWVYQGYYMAMKDEINMFFHFDTYGESYMRYKDVYYSNDRTKSIAIPENLKFVDYFDFTKAEKFLPYMER